MTEYQIHLAAVGTFSDVVNAFNVGMIDALGGHRNGNLDAFNDYLYWPEPHPYRLLLQGWDQCKAVLSKLPAPSGRSMLAEIEEILAINPQAIVTFA